MKTTSIVAAVVLAAAGSFAVLAQAADVTGTTRAQVKADTAAAKANGDLSPERSYEAVPPVEHRVARQQNGGLTRAEVKAETRQYLHDHPNRVMDEYQPFRDEN